MVQSIDGVGESSSATFGIQASQLTSARQNGFQAAAQQLGLSASDLRSAIANGQSIAELAISQGLSTADLQNAVEAALKKQLPHATDEQIANLAQQIIEGPQEQKHRGSRAYSSSNDATGTFEEPTAGSGDANRHIHIVV